MRLALRLALTAAALSLLSSARAQDAAGDGRLAFNNACRTCHTLKEGDDRLGPNLHAIVGRKAGALEGYGYSSAMKGAGLVWDEATLDRFIENPDATVPGHNMKPFGGITDENERRKIVAFLKTGGRE